MQQISNNQKLNSNRGTVFSLQSVSRYYNQDNQSELVKCSAGM
jgi:hypothetical protein